MNPKIPPGAVALARDAARIAKGLAHRLPPGTVFATRPEMLTPAEAQRLRAEADRASGQFPPLSTRKES